jgi:hypothetical protein
LLGTLKAERTAAARPPDAAILPHPTAIAGYLKSLFTLLAVGPIRGREILSRFVAPIVMTPESQGPGRRYRATGPVLFPGFSLEWVRKVELRGVARGTGRKIFGVHPRAGGPTQAMGGGAAGARKRRGGASRNAPSRSPSRRRVPPLPEAVCSKSSMTTRCSAHLPGSSASTTSRSDDRLRGPYRGVISW